MFRVNSPPLGAIQAQIRLQIPRSLAAGWFILAPKWALYPLVLFATLATVIASQAVISGAFSLTRQAVQLGQCPHVHIIQTSQDEIGQIYIPSVNWLLMIVTISLVLGFGSSSKLAGAYGVAVSTTMVITVVLAFFIAIRKWHWNLITAGMAMLLFLTVDIAFLGANMMKIKSGGWFPLVAGLAVFTLMTTWRRGREILSEKLREDTESLEDFIVSLAGASHHRVPGVAVFMSSSPIGIPTILHHHLVHNQVLHEMVIILTVLTEKIPRVSATERVTVSMMEKGFVRVIVRYGFMQSPNVPVALRQCEAFGMTIDLAHTTYYLSRETIISTPQKSGMMQWQEKLFSFMSRNSLTATAFFNIPASQVVELGQQVEI